MSTAEESSATVPRLARELPTLENGGISLLDRQGRISVVLERRRGVGGMALHEAGGVVFGGRDISWSPLDSGESKTLLAAADADGAIGFNDLTTDAAGRVYVWASSESLLISFTR